MEKKSYSELLKDPRWQKKRLEIMQRDNFTCQHCGRTDRSLQVHHLHYAKDKNPWEYDNDSLITLCEDCHRAETENNKEIYGELNKLKESFSRSGLSMNLLKNLLYQFSYFIYAVKNDELCEDFNPNEDSFLKSLVYCCYDCMNYSDARALEKLGCDMSEFLDFLYPQLKDNNGNKEVK